MLFKTKVGSLRFDGKFFRNSVSERFQKNYVLYVSRVRLRGTASNIRKQIISFYPPPPKTISRCFWGAYVPLFRQIGLCS